MEHSLDAHEDITEEEYIEEEHLEATNTPPENPEASAKDVVSIKRKRSRQSIPIKNADYHSDEEMDHVIESHPFQNTRKKSKLDK